MRQLDESTCVGCLPKSITVVGRYGECMRTRRNDFCFYDELVIGVVLERDKQLICRRSFAFVLKFDPDLAGQELGRDWAEVCVLQPVLHGRRDLCLILRGVDRSVTVVASGIETRIAPMISAT